MDLLFSLWDMQGGKAVVSPTDRAAGGDAVRQA